ncbi:MAG: SDR family oxidoreductase [Ignavibacteriae bacterium]|nr:SDR family oxidoreductase [Ignavibacteriota bacterium]MCB9217339.1 SDR family oxidoreductase [Ignavibacteria bacterium]
MESLPNTKYGLILGASSGFGAATGIALAKRGYNIIGVHLDRSATIPEVERVRSEIESHGVTTHFFNVNAADAAKRGEVLDEIGNLFAENSGGTIQLLLHSLAFGTLRPLVPSGGEKGVTQSQLEMTLDVMANSLVYWTQEIVGRGLMGEGGRILALTSSGSRHVLPNYGPVSAAKSALESYCRQLAFELGSQQISVNAIEAGVTDTPALRKIPGNEAIIENARKRNPNKRLTTAEEVAKIIGLIASEDGGWINGTTIRVDGGESIVELDWRENQA